MFSTVSIERELIKKEKYKKLYTELTFDEVAKVNGVLLEALLKLDKVCRENNLKYMLFAGGLIGAVRNGRCIPWDDDIDVIMPRSDYKKLGQIISEKESKDWILMYPEDNSVITLVAHFYNKNIKLSELLQTKIADTKVFETYIYIDIQPIDLCSDNRFIDWLKGHLVDLLAVSYTSRRCFKKNDLLINIMAKESFKLRVNLWLRKILAIPTLFISKKRLFQWIDKILSSSHGKKMATPALGAVHYFGEAMPYDVWFPINEIELEGHMIMCPQSPELYLKHRYGDYKKIPTLSEQKERMRRLKSDWESYL